jgi:hypothetical protein
VVLVLAALGLRAQVVNPPSSSGGGGVIACAATPGPGNTTAGVRVQCQDASGNLFACNNSGGCTVIADWAAVSGSGGPPTGAAGGIFGAGATYPNPTPLANSLNLPGSPTATKPASTSNSTQIATTNWVQQKLAALNPATAVAAATTGVLSNAPNYANGSSGVGATLTATSFGALIVDGVTLTLNQRVLVNNQAAALQNGIYSLTTVGNGSTDYILTRATDFNTVTAINNAGVIPVTSGTVNNSTTWALDTAISAIGSSAINYDQTNAQPPVVTNVNGVPCTAGASPGCTANWIAAAPTTLHVAQFIGTGGELQDGGAMPVSPTTNQNIRTIGAVLTPTALTSCVYVAFAGTINAFHAVAGDGATVDTVLVKVETQPTFATFISTGVSGASDISNGGEQLTSVLGKVDTTLTSWTTTLAAGTTVCFVGSTFSAGTSVNANINVAAQ